LLRSFPLFTTATPFAGTSSLSAIASVAFVRGCGGCLLGTVVAMSLRVRPLRVLLVLDLVDGGMDGDVAVVAVVVAAVVL
jgi:hypothetical protein